MVLDEANVSECLKSQVKIARELLLQEKQVTLLFDTDQDGLTSAAIMARWLVDNGVEVVLQGKTPQKGATNIALDLFDAQPQECKYIIDHHAPKYLWYSGVVNPHFCEGLEPAHWPDVWARRNTAKSK